MADHDQSDRTEGGTAPAQRIQIDLDYNRPRRRGRGMRHFRHRRALKRRLTKTAFFTVIVAVSLLAGYMLSR